jgi:hypothetical protein
LPAVRQDFQSSFSNWSSFAKPLNEDKENSSEKAISPIGGTSIANVVK